MNKTVIVLIILIALAVGIFSYYLLNNSENNLLNNSENNLLNNSENNLLNNSENEKWKNDQIVLMRDNEINKIGCFGCNDKICADPLPGYTQIEESKDTYCGNNFEIFTTK